MVSKIVTRTQKITSFKNVFCVTAPKHISQCFPTRPLSSFASELAEMPLDIRYLSL